ncbi:MAG: hypothetical protein HFJ17_02605 [Clostridia bacterium]|nr:hypothetical protein [Clostridia bacterium]
MRNLKIATARTLEAVHTHTHTHTHTGNLNNNKKHNRINIKNKDSIILPCIFCRSE